MFNMFFSGFIACAGTFLFIQGISSGFTTGMVLCIILDLFFSFINAYVALK